MSSVDLSIASVRPSEIPQENEIISAAAGLIRESHSWTPGRAFLNHTVQTYRTQLPDGSSWHCRVSQHSKYEVSFDEFWDKLGHEWMPTKKAFNDEYLHEIQSVTRVKQMSDTASIWTALYKFPPPISPRVFTILEVTHLDTSFPRTGIVVHVPIDLTGPGDQTLLEKEGAGVKGRYVCVEHITELADDRTEWRCITSSTPAGSIPRFLADAGLPKRMSEDVMGFLKWLNKDRTKGATAASEVRALTPWSMHKILLLAGWPSIFLLVYYKLPLSLRAHQPSWNVSTWSWSVFALELCGATCLGGLYLRLLQATITFRPSLADREILPTSDRLLIGMRDPTIPAILEFGETLELDQVIALVRERLLRIPRMSHRLVTSGKDAPYWEPCGEVDVAEHVREYHIPSGAGYAGLQKLINDLILNPIELSRPPWEIAVIQIPEGGSACFARIHHAITDGRGATDILVACADQSCKLLMHSTRKRATRGSLWSRISDLSTVINARPDPRSSIKHDPPLRIPVMGWLQESFSIAELKGIAANLGGGTVNDILLAAMAGALRTYMLGHGDVVDSLMIHCKLPIDVFHDPSTEREEPALGTYLGDVNVHLPVNLETSKARYVAARSAMTAAKQGFRPGLSAYIAGWVGALSMKTRLKLVAQDAENVSCYISNMKGPTSNMHLDGVPIANIRCLPLGLNNIGVGCAVYSYDSRVNVAVCTDSALIPDPDLLCGYLRDEMLQLRDAAMDASRVSRMLALTASPNTVLSTPNFGSSYSVILPGTMDELTPVLLPSNPPTIERFLAATRTSSDFRDGDFVHHGVDRVRMDITSAFSLDALPSISALQIHSDDSNTPGNTDIPILERHHFAVVEREPMLFGLLTNTIRVSTWGVCDYTRGIGAYESVIEGPPSVRVWKIRKLEDAADGGSERRTRVSETLRGVCPWWLRSTVRRASQSTHREMMGKYSLLVSS